jgi:hypothetical protein
VLNALGRPVIRRRLNAPYITRLIERQPQQPELFVLSQGNTVHYPSSNVSAYGKALQAHLHPNFQGTREPYRTSLGIHQDDQASVGKGLSRIEAGNIQVYRFARHDLKDAAIGVRIS